MATFKVIILGDSGVGKSTLLHRLNTGEFMKKHNPTFEKKVTTLKFTHARLEVYEGSGQKRYSGQHEGFYEGADGAIITFGLDNKLSYKNAQAWYKELQEKCPDIPVVFVATKYDVFPRKNFKMDFLKGRKYFETSSATCTNINDPFETLVNELTGKRNMLKD